MCEIFFIRRGGAVFLGGGVVGLGGKRGGDNGEDTKTVRFVCGFYSSAIPPLRRAPLAIVGGNNIKEKGVGWVGWLAACAR